MSFVGNQTIYRYFKYNSRYHTFDTDDWLDLRFGRRIDKDSSKLPQNR